jgi:hypothetical protein
MNEPHELPVIFAVTGHRDLRPEDEPVLMASVRGIFERFRERYPCTPIVLLTPLAAGADRLVARVAIELKVPFRVPMPFPEADYRKDFDAAENTEFSELLEISEGHYTMPFVGDTTADNVREPARRALQYAMVGAHLARVAHVMIALWNGKASEGVGGTGDIVEYRLSGAPKMFLPSTTLLDAPETGPVYHVVVARRSDPETELPVGTVLVETRRARVDELHDPSRRLYARIDRFNRDRLQLLRKTGTPPAAIRLRDVAEQLATHYQRLYRRTLNLMFAGAVIGAISLAIAHRDAPTYSVVLLYCAFVAFAYIAHAYVERRRWKDRSIEYRALELGLTIQRVWDLVGLETSVADYYLRIQRSEFDWIRAAIRTVHDLAAEQSPDTKLGVVAVQDFVTSQRDFFSVAAPRDERLAKLYRQATDVIVGIGAALTLVLLAIAVGHLISPKTPAALAPVLARIWIHGDVVIRAIAIATILAAVFHEYPRRRAFHAQARRYAIMLQLYERALDLLVDARGEPFEMRLSVAREVIFEVGKEALAENGEWLMMHRELPLDPLHV